MQPVKINFEKNIPSVEVPAGQNLMQALLDAGRPVSSSCGGEGVCAKCFVRIVKGQENLSLPGQTEKDLIEIHEIPKGHRISCQTEVLGDVTVDTKYW